MTTQWELSKKDYKQLFVSIKEEIQKKQYEVGKIINISLIQLYRNIGEKLNTIQENRWDAVVPELAKDLKHIFPDIKGFSQDNLRRMKKFYVIYASDERVAPLVQQVSSSNHIVIMEKRKDDFEREFYLKLSIKQGCSKRVLMNKIASKEYERYMVAHKDNNFAIIEEATIDEKTENILKDQYIFDFLALWKKHSEKELEKKLLEKLKNFLMELWLWFAYMGNQFELKIDGDSYFLDLLFYHTKLKCYVVIELKIGAFKPEYAGKLNFYVNAVNKYLKAEDDNSTIGLLLCKKKETYDRWNSVWWYKESFGNKWVFF